MGLWKCASCQTLYPVHNFGRCQCGGHIEHAVIGPGVMPSTVLMPPPPIIADLPEEPEWLKEAREDLDDLLAGRRQPDPELLALAKEACEAQYRYKNRHRTFGDYEREIQAAVDFVMTPFAGESD